MTEFDNRKHARTPRGYKAVYGQNGITYHPADYKPRKAAQPFNWTALILAVIVTLAVGIAVIWPLL